MAKATQYEFETLCRAILDAVGGSQNIANVFHCITRLRIVPVNRDLVDMAKLSSIKGILKVVESSGQIQCVIGTTVPEVYNDFIAISGINPGGEVKADAADTASDAAAVQEKKEMTLSPMRRACAFTSTCSTNATAAASRSLPPSSTTTSRWTWYSSMAVGKAARRWSAMSVTPVPSLSG